MKFTRSNFKSALRSAEGLRRMYWQQRNENDQLRQREKKYLRENDELQERLLKSLQQQNELLSSIIEDQQYEVDLMIAAQKADIEYLNRQSLFVAFGLTNYRSN